MAACVENVEPFVDFESWPTVVLWLWVDGLTSSSNISRARPSDCFPQAGWLTPQPPHGCQGQNELVQDRYCIQVSGSLS